jgi:hypothetical protein
MKSLANLALGAAALALLAGCAAPPQPAAPTAVASALESATVLLPVRLALPADPDGPAPLVALTLATAAGPHATFTQVPAATVGSAAATPAPAAAANTAANTAANPAANPANPAASAADSPAATPAAGMPADPGGRDYLFRLPLPPGRYRLASLQLREGHRQRALPLDLPFEVDSPAPRYLGRLIVRPGPDGALALDTAWQPHEDIARYRSQPAAGLRAQGVQLQPVVARGPAAASATVAAAAAPVSAPPPRTDPMDSALANASAALRQAFQRYRTLKPPKAFAVSDDGRWSSAHGAGDAPVRSLMDCAHQGGRCRLLAIDDRLVVQGAR